MKYVKILGLLAVAAAALMAFAGTASATRVTSPAGTLYTGTIHAHSEGHAILDSPVGKIECTGTVGGTITAHGTGVTATGPITTLQFGSPVGTCTEGWHVTVVANGTLELHYIENGTSLLTSSGATVSATVGGITCNYATNNTAVGHLTDTSKTGGPATFDISAKIPVHTGSSIFCGTQPTTWTGSYQINTPNVLTIDH